MLDKTPFQLSKFCSLDYYYKYNFEPSFQGSKTANLRGFNFKEVNSSFHINTDFFKDHRVHDTILITKQKPSFQFLWCKNYSTHLWVSTWCEEYKTNFWKPVNRHMRLYFIIYGKGIKELILDFSNKYN